MQAAGIVVDQTLAPRLLYRNAEVFMRRAPARGPGFFMVVALVVAGCATDVIVDDGTTDPDSHDEDDGEHDILLSDPDVPDRWLFVAATTVGQVARTACSTAGVRPLSEQLLTEVECLRPGTLARIDNIANVSLGAGALPKLNAGAATALRNAVAGAGTLAISSSTRATAQQYVLYHWYSNGRCTGVVSLAAKPGRSNHESGVAIDVPAYATWKSRLTARGFAWFGSGDAVHFDYRGAGAVDIRPLAVKAFQRLWNRNHPGDRIAEDGVWGTGTASRMDRSPAGGFAIGPQCGVTPPPDPPPPNPPPQTATLQGVIYEGSDTAARIAGATVALGTGRSTTTSSSGQYEFTGLAPGPYAITVTATGFRAATATRTVAAGADNWGSVSLTRGGATGSLIGVVYRGTDTSARLAGASVRLGSGQTATADASGVYRFAAVGEGSVTITASAAGHLARSITRTIAPAAENWGSVGLSQGQALESQCGGIGAAGECDGAVVAYCHDGELVTVDCAAHGGTCGWNDAESYHDCR